MRRKDEEEGCREDDGGRSKRKECSLPSPSLHHISCCLLKTVLQLMSGQRDRTEREARGDIRRRDCARGCSGVGGTSQAVKLSQAVYYLHHRL